MADFHEIMDSAMLDILGDDIINLNTGGQTRAIITRGTYLDQNKQAMTSWIQLVCPSVNIPLSMKGDFVLLPGGATYALATASSSEGWNTWDINAV